MVVLDTNVVSELMRDAPSADVLVWMDGLRARRDWLHARPRWQTQCVGARYDPEGNQEV